MSADKTRCPVCSKDFPTTLAMRQHFNDAHRVNVNVTDQVPASTISGHLPIARCENCTYWGKANNLTVCRKKPGVPAMIQINGQMQCVSLCPPALANEWCGEWASGTWPTQSVP